MENERTPVLYDRKGLWLCKGCKKLMDSREQIIRRGIAVDKSIYDKDKQ